MKTIAIVPNRSIEQKLQFANYSPTDVYWKFKEVEGGTEVTWGMKNESNPFLFKIIAAMSGGWDNMFNPMLNKGLNKLDTIIQEELKKNPPKPKANYHTTEIVQKQLPEQYFIGYFIKGKISELMNDFQNYMPKVGQYMAQHNLIGKSTIGAIYTKWDMKNDTTEYYIGLFTDTAVIPKEELQKVTIPAGNSVSITKFGPYGEGDFEAHMDIEKYMKAHNLKQNKYVWEKYMNDPAIVKPNEVQTDIYYAVK